jgi:hypothetical protein
MILITASTGMKRLKTMKMALAMMLLTTLSAAAAEKELAPGIRLLGMIDHPQLKECSGVVPARANTNLFWMHSDGRRPVLYAVQRSGHCVETYVVDTPGIHDWEDIARDDAGHLYLADIGNNDALRKQLAVYQFAEPDPADSSKLLPVLRSWTLRFPAEPFDCESLFIWKGHGYVVSKLFDDAPAAIYRFSLQPASGPVTLEFVAKLPVTSPVTGADISPDGKKLALTAKSGVFLFVIDGDVARAATAVPAQVKFKDKHIEGCCFVVDGVLVTAETGHIYLFTEKAFARSKAKVKK